MGSNIFLGNICYITKAIAAVLQLGVTTDFSIFLYHKYEAAKKTEKNNNKAMSKAIHETLVSVLGSSLTTIAGFLALCTMQLTLGTDIGIVMAKGVLFGLLCVVILFPALLLVFDKQIEKTKHKNLLPEFNGIKNFVLKHNKLIFIVFIVLLIPAYITQTKTPVYYKLDSSIPDTYGYTTAQINYALRNCSANYNTEALEQAKTSIEYGSYSRTRLIKILRDYDGFTTAQINYALRNCNANYNTEALEAAQYYKKNNYSNARIKELLEYYGFTTTQINYAIRNLK